MASASLGAERRTPPRSGARRGGRRTWTARTSASRPRTTARCCWRSSLLWRARRPSPARRTRRPGRMRRRRCRRRHRCCVRAVARTADSRRAAPSTKRRYDARGAAPRPRRACPRSPARRPRPRRGVAPERGEGGIAESFGLGARPLRPTTSPVWERYSDLAPPGAVLMSTVSDFVRLTVQRKCPFGWSLMVDDAAPWRPGGPPARTYLLMVLREMPSSRAVARIESPCRRAC